MIGLLFLAVLGFFVWACVLLTKLVLRKIPSRNWRRVIGPIVFVALLVLPIVDEIIGGFQLRALCQKNAMLKVDAEKIKGKKVRVSTDPANKEVDGTSVRILYSRSSYRDVDTNEELASSGRYVATGGWLIRTLSTDNYIVPLTFSSTCGGGLELANYEVTLIK